MSIIAKIRSYFFNAQLNQQLPLTKQDRTSMDFEYAESIGILFDATDAANRNKVLNYADGLTKQGKKVTLLGFVNNKQKELSLPFKFFTLREVNWKMIPQGRDVEQFKNENFDILINLYGGLIQPIEYISALSKANLRVGPFSENPNCFDLMIDTPKGTDLEHLIKQIDFFLNRINKPAYEPAF